MCACVCLCVFVDSHAAVARTDVGPTQNRLYRLADRFGIESYGVDNSGLNKLTVAGHTQEYVGDIPTLSPFALLDLNNVICQHYNLTKDLPCDKVRVRLHTRSLSLTHSRLGSHGRMSDSASTTR